MMAHIVDELVQEAKAKAEDEERIDYPGKRWNDEGGLPKYLE